MLKEAERLSVQPLFFQTISSPLMMYGMLIFFRFPAKFRKRQMCVIHYRFEQILVHNSVKKVSWLNIFSYT